VDPSRQHTPGQIASATRFPLGEVVSEGSTCRRHPPGFWEGGGNHEDNLTCRGRKAGRSGLGVLPKERTGCSSICWGTGRDAFRSARVSFSKVSYLGLQRRVRRDRHHGELGGIDIMVAISWVWVSLWASMGGAGVQKLDPSRYGWLSDYAVALREARRSGKPIFLVFRCEP